MSIAETICRGMQELQTQLTCAWALLGLAFLSVVACWLIAEAIEAYRFNRYNKKYKGK